MDLLGTRWGDTMRRRTALKAVAFILNGAVFLIGLARSQGRLAPPDYVYVGLLLAAPLVSWFGLALSYRRRVDPEVMATVKAAVVLLNLLLMVFVLWLASHLDPDIRAEESLWLVLLFAAAPINLLAISPAAARGSPASERTPT